MISFTEAVERDRGLDDITFVAYFLPFSRKLREGFLVKKRLPCTHHYTYTAHLHCATAFAHIAPLAPLTYTMHTPLHLHRSPTHHYTYTAHLHCAAACAHIASLAPLTYTTPQHLHTSHHVYCTHHYTYTAHLHRATAFAHIAFTSPSIFSFFKAGVGSSGIVGRHPLRVSCASHRSCSGAVRISKLNSEPSAGFVRVASLPLWRRANF